MFKGKETLFNWIIFHGNNLQMFTEGLNIVGDTYFDWHNILTLLKNFLNRHISEIQLGMETNFEILKSL